jgi:hypothetical protein
LIFDDVIGRAIVTERSRERPERDLRQTQDYQSAFGISYELGEEGFWHEPM